MLAVCIAARKWHCFGLSGASPHVATLVSALRRHARIAMPPLHIGSARSSALLAFGQYPGSPMDRADCRPVAASAQ